MERELARVFAASEESSKGGSPSGEISSTILRQGQVLATVTSGSTYLAKSH